MRIVFYIFLAVLVVEIIFLLRAKSTQKKQSPTKSSPQEYVKLVATPPADTTFHFGTVKEVNRANDKVTLLLELIQKPDTKLPAFTITDKTLLFEVKDNQQLSTTSDMLKVGQRVVLVSNKYDEDTKTPAEVREIILNIPANGAYPARIIK